MFTGLVESLGKVVWLRRTTKSVQLAISAPDLADSMQPGDSLAINGCCLTLTSKRKDHLSFDLLEETLLRTNFGSLRPDHTVNLERALAANGRIGGHFVQGHVDGKSNLLERHTSGTDLRLDFALPQEFAAYLVYKGSIAINGVSLTVAELTPTAFAVWLIPQTQKATNLGSLKRGAEVNLEFDILAKYTERILATSARPAVAP